ncbi:thioredoxin domain-containing protein [Candidatus Nomurabacteria bacterium]|nr:thioredoxin domain-containing protein [Candidatus Nomurabacteria bacterium]
MEHTTTHTAWLDTPKAILLGALIIGLGLALGLGLGGGERVKKEKVRMWQVDAVLKENNINKSDYQACLEDGAAEARVQADMDRAVDLGITGTPGNLIVHIPTGRSVLLPGALPLNIFNQAIEALRTGGTLEGIDIMQTTATVDEDEHILGNPDGDIMIFEYSDYDCPFCVRVHETLHQLIQQDTSVAWAYRHFPLTGLHPQALPKAFASECIAELGGEEAFWSFTDTNFAGKL